MKESSSQGNPSFAAHSTWFYSTTEEAKKYIKSADEYQSSCTKRPDYTWLMQELFSVLNKKILAKVH